MSSSDIRSIRFGRHGVRTSDADFAAFDYNSGLHGANAFLSLDSESTQNLESTVYLIRLSDLFAPTYVSSRKSENEA